MTNKQKSFVLFTLRKASLRWYARAEIMRRARVERGKYLCAHCNQIHPRKNVQVDHIIPVVPLSGWDNLDGYVTRLLCDPEGLQVLCSQCHDIKTEQELKERVEIRDKREKDENLVEKRKQRRKRNT